MSHSDLVCTVPVVERFRATTDDRQTFHRTFEAAVRRIVRDSCDIQAEPWGGNMTGYVSERHFFAIDRVRVVRGRRGMVVIDESNLVRFKKDYQEGISIRGNIKGPRRGQKIIRRLELGFKRRWNAGWRLVKSKSKIPMSAT